MQREGKRGLSTVVITLIIILVSLFAIGIIWIAVRNVVQRGSEDIEMGQFTIDASVEVIGINETRNNVSLIITRNPGKGDFTGVVFLFENITSKETVTRHFILQELEARGFELHLEKLGVANLTKLSIYPLYRSSSNEFTMGAKTDEYTFTGIEKFLFRPGGGAICGNNIKEMWEACDGTDLAGQTCISQGFIGGNLACYPPGDMRECRFDTSGCSSPQPQCSDGVDNDANGCSDYPSDTGCSSSSDTSESGGSCVAGDTTPPTRSNGAPTGTLLAGTTQTTISLNTNENAVCRYSTSAGTPYASMKTFSTTGGTSHSNLTTGLVNGQSYNYYVRCNDTAGNFNTNDSTISFSVASSSAGIVCNVTAASCSRSDVLSAINNLVSGGGGGTVCLPPCDQNYSGNNLKIPWGVSIKGSSRGVTILREIILVIQQDTFYGDDITRISDMSIYYGQPIMEDMSRPEWEFRNDYPQQHDTTFILHDMDITGRFSTIISTIRTKGLIYNNNFNIVTSYGIYTHGNDSYYDNINSNDCADTFGKVTQYTIVLENNNWTGYYDHLMDSRTGGSYIFRYNNVTFSVDGAGPLETHGPIWTDPYPTPTDSGGNRFEVYNNTIGNLPGVTSGSSGIFLRGGCWLVYNNKIKDKAQGVMLQVEGSPPWPCSVDLYPVYHQPKDIWIYNNVFSNLSRGDVEVSSPDSTPCIQENRDYYLRAPNLAQDGFTYIPYPYPSPLRLV